MPNTGKTQIPNINHFYKRDYLDRAKENLIHDVFGMAKPIPQNHSDEIYWRRFERLAKNYTPLSEGVTPAGKQLSQTTVFAKVEDFGDYVILTDKLVRETEDAIWAETSDVLVEQAKDSLDCVTREKITIGTNVLYPNGKTGLSQLTSGDVPAYKDLKDISLLLRNANANKVTSFIKPEAGYGTTAVRPAYVAITDPDSIEKFKLFVDETGKKVWDDAENYANMGQLMPGEVGRIGDIRFIETTNAKYRESEDVHTCLVIGAKAYGVTIMDGMSTSIIIHTAKDAGSDDPLEQRASAGWKVSKTAKITNENWIVRYEFKLG